MSALYEFRGPDDIPTETFTEITPYFRLYETEVSMNAEEGSVGASTVTADDPNADFQLVGHRQFRVRETTATGSNTIIYAGYSAERRLERGDFHRTTNRRSWNISLVDINSVLARRIFDKDKADRPAETDVARIAWMLGAEESSLIDDSRYFSHVNPVNMDAADYRGQTVADLINDCAQQSGKNWFVWMATDTNQFSLWYDFASSSNYTSPLRLSNVLSDIDSTWTFALGIDTELNRDPSRVYSGVYLPYDGGAVYVERQSTQATFARRDVVMPSVNVKTASTAKARANRYLTDLATEEDVITTTVHLPAERVNYLMQGMRVQVKASHLDGYEDWQWMRVVARTVKQVSEEFYDVQYDLSAPTPEPVALPVYGILRLSQGPDTANLVHWAFPGDTPQAGYPLQPTTGALEVITDPSPPNGGWPYSGWKVTGTGTVDVTFFATTAGVLIDEILYSITWAIRLNGTVVASGADTAQGFLEFYSQSKTVTVSGLAVVPDDVITATISCIPPTMPFFRTPLGTGQNGERLEITGGSLT